MSTRYCAMSSSRRARLPSLSPSRRTATVEIDKPCRPMRKSAREGVARVRVLFTAPAGIGHLHPLLPLINACQERGHEVRFASDAANCAAAERVGIAVAPAGLSGAERRD